MQSGANTIIEKATGFSISTIPFAWKSLKLSLGWGIMVSSDDVESISPLFAIYRNSPAPTQAVYNTFKFFFTVNTDVTDKSVTKG